MIKCRQPMRSMCLPDGPRIDSEVGQVVQTPTLLLMLSSGTQYRQIHMDGRPLPKDPNPDWMGYSIGHWEGQTLVVETVGFKPRTMLNQTTPHSDRMRIVERIRLKDPQTLVDEMTIEDPLALARPWTNTLTYTRHREWDQIEFICDENNRNPVDETGKTRFILRDNPDAR